MDTPFPTIEDPAPGTEVTPAARQDVAVEKPTLKTLALAEFGPWRTAANETRKTLTGVQHDLSTTAKIKDARSLRQRLINDPLAEARKVSKAVKATLNEVSGNVGAELVAIETEYEQLDELILPQIEAREAEIEAERKRKEEAEAARVQKHKDALALLAGYADKARAPDMTAERIAKGIALVEAVAIDPAAWEEFADRAVEQKAVTLERMRVLHGEALAAEAEAKRLEEERIENERKAAELKAKEDALAEAAAALAKQQAEFAAQQEAAAKAQRDREEAERAKAKKDSEDVAFELWLTATNPSGDVEAVQRQWEASPEYHELHGLEYRAPAPVYTPSAEQSALIERGREIVNDIIAAEVLGDAIRAAAPALAPEVVPLRVTSAEPIMVRAVKLGELCTLLGFTVSEAFLAGLGFHATPTKGTAKIYRHSDIPAICAAISAHVLLLGSEAKKAA